VAEAAAGIMKRLPLFRDKFPGVLPRRERELQYAEGVPVSNFAVRSGKAEKFVLRPPVPATISRIPFAGIGFAFGVLRRKSFVGMFVPGKTKSA